jgi:hypothetical protein
MIFFVSLLPLYYAVYGSQIPDIHPLVIDLDQDRRKKLYDGHFKAKSWPERVSCRSKAA